MGNWVHCHFSSRFSWRGSPDICALGSATPEPCKGVGNLDGPVIRGLAAKDRLGPLQETGVFSALKSNFKSTLECMDIDGSRFCDACPSLRRRAIRGEDIVYIILPDTSNSAGGQNYHVALHSHIDCRRRGLAQGKRYTILGPFYLGMLLWKFCIHCIPSLEDQVPPGLGQADLRVPYQRNQSFCQGAMTLSPRVPVFPCQFTGRGCRDPHSIRIAIREELCLKIPVLPPPYQIRAHIAVLNVG
ncbi:hypothetical protein N7489_011631 [Penicillium chrysogenum]|uniref:uncharacterized protein n=1 Tax=Penicillium chrysogenum TaxID=5076 RepID=UPI0024DF1539|nr:uncharacterized protein N7489_011631 [Penicillium chrysogenum]KAJ5230923.1 hypothetical protein N7489_011631 [Penicillium chrysogenum]